MNRDDSDEARLPLALPLPLPFSFSLMQIELLEMVQQLWLWLWLLNWLSFIPLLVVCWDMNFTLLNGTYYSDKTTALEYIFQLPTLPQPWPGVVFVAHGCGDTAGSFWPKSKTCEECCGLPLGTLLTLRGLQNNFAIIATTARNRCFKSEDFSSLVRILQSFYLQYNISSQIPVHLLGFCKGGQGLGLFLQNQTNLQQLSPIRIASLAVTLSALKFTSAITSMRPFPIPTLLIPMKKDGGVMWEIQKTVPLIRSLEVIPARDWPLTTDCFYTYSRGYFNKSESLTIYHILKENGFLNETNYLRKDPLSYHYRWRQIIQKHAPEIYRRDVSHYHVKRDTCVLAQLLESAYGYHGYPIHQYSVIFEFFRRHSIPTIS